MVRDHPGLEGRILTPDGDLQRFVNVYVDDDDIRTRHGLDTVLDDGTSVVLLSAVAGG